MDLAQQYPPAYLREDRGWELIQIVITFAVLTTVFVSLFFVSRMLNRTLNGLDLYLILPAYICCFGNMIVACLFVKYAGSGRHVVTVAPGTLIIWLKLDLAERIIYPYSIAFPKLAILCLYKRIFTTKLYRHSIIITAVVVILICIVSTVWGLTICRPVAYNWNKRIPGGRCADIEAGYRYISIPNIATDVVMLILPIHGVWNLQMSILHKVGLTVTFMTGCIGIIAAIVRMILFFLDPITKDPTWYLVRAMTGTITESSMYLIAATLPSLRPLLRRAFNDVDYGSFFTRLQGYYNRVFTSKRDDDTSSHERIHSDPNMTYLKAQARGSSAFT